MTSFLAVLLAVVLVLIALLHVYWAFGGRWASEAVIPTIPSEVERNESPVFSPGPVATVMVAVMLTVATFIVLAAEGLVGLPVPAGWVRIGIWAIAGVFFLRAVGDFRYVGFSKRIRETAFARMDTRYYTPLCLALSALALGVALGSG
ncbi:MAG: DUF3995 domain-containing protein [Bacteroidota bacterium]